MKIKKLLKHLLREKKFFLSKKKKRTDRTLGTNGDSKAIQTKSHTEAYTYTLTKKGKGEKIVHPAPKVHLLNLG